MPSDCRPAPDRSVRHTGRRRASRWPKHGKDERDRDHGAVSACVLGVTSVTTLGAMEDTTRTALQNYVDLVNRYGGNPGDDLELCWDSDTLGFSSGGVDIRSLCDPDLTIPTMPEEARIALTNYDRLVRIRGYVALPGDRIIYSHGTNTMTVDWETDTLVFDADTDVDEVKRVSFTELCQPWPGVPYSHRANVSDRTDPVPLRLV